MKVFVSLGFSEATAVNGYCALHHGQTSEAFFDLFGGFYLMLSRNMGKDV